MKKKNQNSIILPSASCFLVPVPFLKVNVIETFRSSSATFSTDQTNTPHGSELSLYSCGKTGDICRHINLTPYSLRSYSDQARGYKPVYEHFPPSNFDSHDDSGVFGRLQLIERRKKNKSKNNNKIIL